MLKIGTVAPSFTLKDQNETDVSLADYKGSWVVLYFYPKALTPGCITQACELTNSAKEFGKYNAKILGISADAPSKLKRFEDKKGINFTLLSNEDKDVIKSYKAWGPKKFMGKEFLGIHRVTYIISPEGKIAHTMPKVKTKTHHQDVLEWLQQNAN